MPKKRGNRGGNRGGSAIGTGIAASTSASSTTSTSSPAVGQPPAQAPQGNTLSQSTANPGSSASPPVITSAWNRAAPSRSTQATRQIADQPAPAPTTSSSPTGGPAVARQAIPTILPTREITTIAVKRPGLGKAGRQTEVFTNACVAEISSGMLYHYDVSFEQPGLSKNKKQTLMKILQYETARDLFRPPNAPDANAVYPGSYDGNANLYMAYRLRIDNDAGQFSITLPNEGQSAASPRPPRVYVLRLKKVAEINPEILKIFTLGKQSQDETVPTTLNALNVAIRMDPMSRYVYNSKSFFTEVGRRMVESSPFELWRGYFQSIRPTIGRMIINVDIATGLFFKEGPLIDLCLDFLGKGRNPNFLSVRQGLPRARRRELQSFTFRLKVRVENAVPGRSSVVTIERLSDVGASDYTFENNGTTTNVADHYRQLQNNPLRYPDILCILDSSNRERANAFPLEKCYVLPGQMAKKEIPKNVRQAMVEFSTQKPSGRLQSIKEGFTLLGYTRSDYLKEGNLGLKINQETYPLSIKARVLTPPNISYNAESKEPILTPSKGKWNMRDKKFWKPIDILRWVFVIYEQENLFRRATANQMVQDMIKAAGTVGMRVHETNPLIFYENGQGNIAAYKQLRKAGAECVKKGGLPQLIVAVLPDGSGNDVIYNAVKSFGDTVAGVATQCLNAKKCYKAKMQYWANVFLKINPKLGGINSVIDRTTGISTGLFDPNNPTIIMGADTIHPPPNALTPSFTSVTGNVDTMAAKYIATINVQTSKQEIIQDLGSMAKKIIENYMSYRKNVEKELTPPKKLLFYRDGVGEGQFKEVMDKEVKILRDVCKELGIAPKITFIVVGKRHHFRFFPKKPVDTDESENCVAGTVVDTDITHPTDFDYYLQSHGGIIGTSRSAHYSVLYDDNKFTPDTIQAISYTLCYVYARSTRSVSIPAPVYYADRVCARARIHFDPNKSLLSDISSVSYESEDEERAAILEIYKKEMKPIHSAQSQRMFFT
ncbi:hypothetical protein VKT23_015091 [Stygiomarasmius scandens]|uniref:Piwi domain-containing protein n=1 Tax=Marasmiellus scandens TaxID=2682957 RepID=A0ABR1IYP6_9AGAR